MIARLVADQSATDLCVTPNARMFGQISGVSRQIDVLIDARHDTDNSRRVIVDAKMRKRKIDVKDVEAFRGLMADVKATHRYLVASSGYTKAAERRAQMAVSIRIVPTDRLENFDPSTWPWCKSSQCERGRIFWDGYPVLSMKLRPAGAPEEQEPTVMSFIHYVGKCDRCGLFHVWCATCGDTMPVPENDENDCGHQCRCRLPWFWLASIEEDEDGSESAELHLVCGAKVRTVDRRSL
ncbi:MAG TPA: restriction endonuclease, partial [Stellaceae bacterium]|nr:restriction endonuclease [Stellaceae bacterium]